MFLEIFTDKEYKKDMKKIEDENEEINNTNKKLQADTDASNKKAKVKDE